MTVTLHGIKNCDSVRKARRWLAANEIAYRFHDFRLDGIDEKLLRNWLRHLTWQTLLNTRGTTWRKLNEAQRADLDEDRAVALMLAQPTLIKRPVLCIGASCHVGFRADDYAALFRQ